MERAGRASHWAGLYEVTPDAHPIFGRTPVEGFFVVAGFSGHGFGIGPGAGHLIADLASGVEPIVDPRPYHHLHQV